MIIIKKIIYIFFILFLVTGFASAQEYAGIGFHLGLHHNVGNMGSQNPGIKIDPQNNYFLGFTCRSNLGLGFIKFGADTTFLINRGEVLDNSNEEISSVKIHYLTIPLFAGFNYQVLDVGKFYMGPGVSYFMASGRVSSSTASLSDDISTTAWGLGFVGGVELNLTSHMRFYFEWQYFSGNSEPVQQTQSTYEWDDFSVDFTGHRILFGFMYYLI